MDALQEVAAPSLDGLKGRALGDFIIGDKLGQGGFGAVYRAEQPLLSREAVIKVLLHRDGGDGEGVQRFLREAKLASQLDHPYCAHVYAFGAEPDGLLWIAMEYVRGVPLDRLLAEQGPLSLPRFVPLFERICEVVQSAHDQGIVHRDLKPANVLVISRAGRLLPKLLDFGIARLRSDLTRSADVPPTLQAGPPVLEVSADEEPRGPRSPRGAPLDTPSRLKASVALPLTRGGSFVGSPHSMAPEQWLDPRAVDARTDIYALGVLSFQCLTGRLPFDGPDEMALAREHARKPPPALPPELPAELSAVVTRALAKKPQDRYATAIELAAAVREAAGLRVDPAQLPQLPDTLRESLIASAPQPLAEAVAVLEASRSAPSALRAAREVRAVLCRLLGVLALACRARVGPGGGEDSPAAARLLTRLRDGTLSAVGWGELAREWLRPFAERRDAHPVPELVSFFFEEGSDAENPRSAALGVEVLDAPASAQGSDAAARRSLSAELVSLTQLLTGAAFLAGQGYLWAVCGDGALERWMGVRRTPRAAFGECPKSALKGQVVLVDGGGRLVVMLHPFAQALSPTPGVAEELFLLEARGRYGAKLLAEPAGFERQDESLWKELEALLPALRVGQSAAPVEPAAPYRGLVAFTAEDRDNFFGREGEAEAFANRLRVQPLIAVVGPSGAGKSSFVQAGVIPTLPETWRAVVVRPGPSPLAALEARLLAEGLEVRGLAERLRQDDAALGEALATAASARGGIWVLVVDQFEELLTLGAPVEERQLYARAVAKAAERADAPVRVILTLRDDFLIRLQQLPGLRDRLAQGVQLLGTPAPEDLRRILVEPARRAGFAFEDDALPEEMVRAVAEQPGALALLSFTASTLWELRDRPLRLLSRKAYHGVGGVGGALGHHAEATLAALAPQEQKLVRECFRHLVTAEGTRAVLSRVEMEQVLGDGPLAQRVLERLIGARLLVASEGVQGEPDRIEVIHEAMLSSWPRLVRWQREDAESARMKDLLRTGARQWSDRGKPTGLLWRDDALTEYRLWRARYGGALTDVEEQFVAASLREDTRGRRLRRGGVLGAFALLCAGLVVVSAYARAAKDRTLRLFEEQGRTLVLQHDFLRALVYLSEAYSAGRDGAGLRYLVGKAVSGLEGVEATLLGHDAPIIGVAYSPDGSRAVTVGDEPTALLWNGRTGARVAALTGHAGGVLQARFSARGDQLWTTGRDGTVRFWDGRSGAPGQVLAAHDGPAEWAELTPEGDALVTAGADRTVKLWRMPAGTLLRTYSEHQDEVYAARWRPGVREFVTGSNDGTARVYGEDSTTARLVLRHAGPIYFVAYSPDGARILTASDDHTAKLWDAQTGGEVASLQHHSPVVYASFSPDSNRVATASQDPEPRVWDGRTGAAVHTLKGHVSSARFVTFSPDGQRLISGGGDAAAIVWDAGSGQPLCRLVGHLDTVFRAVPSPDGRQLLTGSLEGVAKLWDLARCSPPVRLDAPEGSVDARYVGTHGVVVVSQSPAELRLLDAQTGALQRTVPLGPEPARFVVPSPDGRLAATDDGNRVRLSSLAGGPARVLEGHRGKVRTAAFSRDGALLATGGEDAVLLLWRTADGEVTRTLPHPQAVVAVAFSPDGAKVATGGADGVTRVFDVKSGAEVATLSRHRTHVVDVQFSPDGERLVTAGWDKQAKVWSVKRAALLTTLEGHSAELVAASFTLDGQYVLTSAFDASTRLWDAATGTELDTFPADGPVRSLSLAPDGRGFLVSSAAAAPRLWTLPSPAPAPAPTARLVECFIQLKLENERLVKRVDTQHCQP